MIKVVGFEKRYGWRKIVIRDASLFLKGTIYNYTDQEILQTLQDSFDPSSFFSKLDGHFAGLYLSEKKNILFTDRIRSIPLFFQKEELVVTDCPALVKDLSLENINQRGLLTYRMSGYTQGSDSLLQGLISLRPSEFLNLDENSPKSYWVDFYKNLDDSNDTAHYKKVLAELTLKSFEKILRTANGKQIVIPLSAGVDSRVVVSCAKEFGYDNIYCISYGRKGNFEAKIAQKICKHLGIRWNFIETNPKEISKYLNSDSYLNYVRYSDSYSSIPFFQDHFVLYKLKGKIDKNAIFINGNTGDFTSGAHIHPELHSSSPIELSKVLELYAKKHCSLWEELSTPENLSLVYDCLNEDLEVFNVAHNSNQAFKTYEFLEFINRQSKFVITGQRNYEFFGYDWKLPLWDTGLIEFWAKMPLKYKMNQKLYVETLNELNWGGVWSNIPLNQHRISPAWVPPVRNLCKLLFFPFGRKYWGSFDKRAFGYFTEPLGLYHQWPYLKVLFDDRGFRNIVSWRSEKYLKEKHLL